MRRNQIQKILQVVAISALFGITSATMANAGDFRMPSQAQIAAAASTPSSVPDLLQGASPEQAALIVRAVIAAVIAQADTVERAAERIQSIVSAATASIAAETQTAFVTALGSAIADTPSISGSPAIVAAIQAGANLGGASDLNLGSVFNASYSAAGGTVTVQQPAQNQVPIDTTGTPPPPPTTGTTPPSLPPPVSTPYSGQQI